MNENSTLNKLILKGAYALIIVLIIAVIALLILKYQVEGEQNMPFKLSSVFVLSNAEAYQENENNDYKWDTEIYQTNDIYFNIEKNKNYKETQIIKNIKIDNITVNEQPKVGKIEFYRVSNEDDNLFTYKEDYQISDCVEYIGDTKTDLGNLKISNQGGTIILRVVNKTGKRYQSNEDELEHSGKLLNQVEISSEDIKATISFDLTIELESDISFKANVQLNLPVGNIEIDGYANSEITKNIIFKREL